MSEQAVMTSHPTIQVGSTGDAVRVAQKALIARNYSVGSGGADGVFGPYTLHAVRQYQYDRSQGQYWAFNYPLAVDGIVGPETWGRLDPSTIREGSTGRTVTLLQHILNALHTTTPELRADGDFGPKTEAAVKVFQRHHTLADDGVVGPMTWRALRS